jgi:hypothetical protein
MPPSTDAPQCAFGGARPFASADEAWFWFMRALKAQRRGSWNPLSVEAVARPCEPDDVLRCLDQLYRRRQLTREDVLFLRLWGENQVAPDPQIYPSAARVWHELMALLTWPLQRAGVVSTWHHQPAAVPA